MDAKPGRRRSTRLAPEGVVRELSAAGLAAEIVDVDLPEQYVVAGRITKP